MNGQKLLLSEIAKRAIIIPNKTIKRVNDGVNGLMLFGENNDYPQVMERLIGKSTTAKAASNIYAKFLSGQGFESEEINNVVVGYDSRGKKITLKRQLREVAESCSINNGFYIHCNFNNVKEITSTHLKSFKNMRFAIPDDTGFNAKALYYDNWEKDRTRGRYDKSKIKSFNVFNINENAFIEQVRKAGGIEKYKGQIFFNFLDTQYFYPLSVFDSVYLDCDTEGEIGLYKNRQLRNGFFKKTVMRVQPGGTDEERRQYVDGIRSTLGADGDSLLVLEDDLDADGNLGEESNFRIQQLESDIEDGLFDNWERTVPNNIRKAAKGLPAILIDYEESKLGNTSGAAVQEAVNFYNLITEPDRASIEESFEEIYSNFNNPILKNNSNWKIKPFNLIEQKKDGITDNNTTATD